MLFRSERIARYVNAREWVVEGDRYFCPDHKPDSLRRKARKSLDLSQEGKLSGDKME